MKHLLAKSIIIIGIIAFGLSIQPRPQSAELVSVTLDFIKQHANSFAASTEKLQTVIGRIDRNNPLSIEKAKEALKECRAHYKSIEFFLTYFFRSNSEVYNEPPIYEVEEPFHEYKPPSGLQVIEALLFSEDPVGQKNDLLQQAVLLHSSASDIYSYLYNLQITDKQILESVRLGLIRIISLGITGFDAPELKTGISESGCALDAFKIILRPLLMEKNQGKDSVSYYLEAASKMIRDNRNFDAFDRLHFLTEIIFPLQHHLGLLIDRNGLELNTTGILNYHAKNLFSADALYIDPRSNPHNLPIFPTDINVINTAMQSRVDPAIVNLGKKLFFEKGLSGNASRSCASCHRPENYFSDGLPKALTLDGNATVSRNTPSLLYAACQYSQFWDGRATSLEDQIGIVLKTPIEMNADYKVIVQRLSHNQQVTETFKKAFPQVRKDSVITIDNLILSITGFLKTLAPFNSPFDNYMRGDKNALTVNQKKGFNLFMGKAQCATCHFIPLFNGLLPPFYDKTELENLGVTKNTNFAHPQMDNDRGRFDVTPAKYNMGLFKTPTLRNIAKTAPYMHNGEFPDLALVLDFYNKGGGEGLGLTVPNQTLSSKPLELTNTEIEDIIAFMNTLTDFIPQNL